MKVFFRESIASENFCEIKENLSNEKLSNLKKHGLQTS